MSNLPTTSALPASSPEMIKFVGSVDAAFRQVEQVKIETYHLFHAGVYTRTIKIPAGVMLTTALMKIPTMLTISGRVSVLIGDGERIEISGFAVLPASAGRKQVFIAHEDTFAAMSFKTDVVTVADAEKELTDEWELLGSRHNVNHVEITGE